MRSLDVDLLDRPDSWRLVSWVAVCVATACLADGAWRAWSHHELLSHEAAVNAHLRDRLETLRAHRAATTKDAANPYARQDEDIARLARFDIDGVFTSAESAQVSGVRAMSVEISPADATVRLQIEAPAVQAVLDYVDALNAGLPVPAWRVARVDGVAGGAGASVKAQIDGHWRDGGQP